MLHVTTINNLSNVFEAEIKELHAYCNGFVSDTAVIVTDIVVDESFRNKGNASTLLTELSLFFKKPVHPLGVLPEAEQFWAKFVERQGAGDLSEQDIILERWRFYEKILPKC